MVMCAEFRCMRATIEKEIHNHGGLKAAVPAGTKFLEAPLRVIKLIEMARK